MGPKEHPSLAPPLSPSLELRPSDKANPLQYFWQAYTKWLGVDTVFSSWMHSQTISTTALNDTQAVLMHLL